MRKIWLISIIAFVFLAMAACAGMTPGGEKIYRARGTVEAYEPGKMLKFADKMEIEGYSEEGEVAVMKPQNTGEYTFAITPATDVKGTIKPGERVLVRYTQSGGMAGGAKTAVSIERIWGK